VIRTGSPTVAVVLSAAISIETGAPEVGAAGVVAGGAVVAAGGEAPDGGAAAPDG
jgi:hypothetical protein